MTMSDAFAPAVEAALSKKIGHPPPFTDEELMEVESLVVKNTADLSGLTQLTALRVLILRGYGGTNLAPLAGLPDLSSLTVEFSVISDLSVLPQLPVHTLILRCNNIEDLRPLLEIRGRDLEIDVRGNPLSEVSYREIAPALREHGAKVEVSGEREWRLTRRLHSMGLPFGYYDSKEGFRLCRPGLEFTPYPEWDHPRIAPDELERMLDTDPASVHTLFEREDLM
jgi:hypothetical protein